MKKIEIGQAVQIVANIGVIAGIALLAFEISQNNEFLAAEARASRAATSQSTFAPILQNPLVAEVLAADQGLSVEDLVKLYYFQRVLIGWQYSWGEFKAGVLSEGDLPVRGWVIAIDSFPGFVAHWERTREASVFDREFIEFVDADYREYLQAQ